MKRVATNVKILLILSIVFSCNLLVLSRVGADASVPVKVGCLFPLTGPSGLYGRDSIIGIELALEYLAAQKNEKYPELDVQIRDTRSKLLRAVQVGRLLVEQENVEFLCGVVSSQIALAITELARKRQVFFIGTDHASPQLVTNALHPYYFRLNNGTRQSMLAGSLYIKQNFYKGKKLKLAFIGPDYNYGYQAWRDLQYFLNQNGVKFEIVGEFWPKLFAADYSVYTHYLMDSQPDIVINGHWGSDLVNFVKQANSLHLFEQTTFMNFDAGGNYEILNKLGDQMPLGLILSARHHVNWPNTSQNMSFVESFLKKSGRYPSYAAQGAYSGIIAIATALKNMEMDERQGLSRQVKIRHALENLRLKLPEDPEGFESFIDPTSHQILQAQAIGKTMLNSNYPPAKVMLGDWSVYLPSQVWPLLSE